MFLHNFFNVNIEKVLSCVCHMHAHDFSTPVHSLSFWDVNICKTCWGTEVANSFFPCIVTLWNSVPAYCFLLSYNLHLFKGSISMHLASLTITWKPANKNIDNFISLLSQVWINKLIWKTISRFWHISYHMKSQSLQLYIFWHFTVILRLLCKHICLLPFSPKASVSSLFT